MRILYWAELFPPYVGGASILGSKLVPALVQRGHSVEVVSSHRGLDLPDEGNLGGIPVHRFAFWHALAEGRLEEVLTLRRRLARLKERFAPDVIHLNLTGASGVFHLHTERAHPCPVVVAVRLAPPRGRTGEGSLVERLLTTATWITANSLAILNYVRSLAPGIEARSSVIYNGLEPPKMAPEPLPFNPPHLLGVGHLGPEKGFDVAVDAFALLRSHFPEARFSLVGEGSERSALEQRVRERGIAETVTFHGQVEPGTVAALMNQATVVVVPSRWEEAFGLVALEAALLERPVVASRVGGLVEVVLDGETGILVPRNQPEALATALAALLADPPLARALGRKASSRALECFGWDRYVNAYESLYRSLLETRGKSGASTAGMDGAGAGGTG